jgi:tRNA(Ile)-lysidine synthase
VRAPKSPGGTKKGSPEGARRTRQGESAAGACGARGVTQHQATEAAERLLASVAEGGLLAGGRPVLVMLSGGRDSVCLLDLAVRVSGTEAVSAIHVNYGLRPSSGDDQRHCQALCERLGVSLSVRRAPAAPPGNLQAWARDFRYRAAQDLTGADIAAGHTATDQVETILYRLASSPSRRALLGMRPREPLGQRPRRWLVRPLLGVARDQTAAYCCARALPWRDDETNDQDVYTRGRVRARLVPALRSIHPAAERNLLALAEILRDEGEVLDELVGDLLRGAGEVPLARLRALQPALARLVVQRLADQAAGGPAPGTARRLPELLALPDRGRAALDLPHGVRAIVERGALRFVRRP